MMPLFWAHLLPMVSSLALPRVAGVWDRTYPQRGCQNRLCYSDSRR